MLLLLVVFRVEFLLDQDELSGPLVVPVGFKDRLGRRAAPGEGI